MLRTKFKFTRIIEHFIKRSILGNSILKTELSIYYHHYFFNQELENLKSCSLVKNIALNITKSH